jgi:hypothetical protein
VVQDAAHEDSNVIFGAVINESMGEMIRVTVIATGFAHESSEAVSPMDMGASATFHQYRTLKNPPKPMASLSNKLPLTTRPTETIEQQAENLKKVADSFTATSTPSTSAVLGAGLGATAVAAATASVAAPAPVATETTSLVAPAITETPVATEVQAQPVIEKIELAETAAEPMSSAPTLAAEPAESILAPEISEIEEPVVAAPASAIDPETMPEGDLPHAYELAMMTLNAMEDKSDKSEEPTVEAAAEAPASEQTVTQGFEGAKAASSSIDQKIDEAIALAERIKSSHENESDELDIPAFIRNGVMDLPETP